MEVGTIKALLDKSVSGASQICRALEEDRTWAWAKKLDEAEEMKEKLKAIEGSAREFGFWQKLMFAKNTAELRTDSSVKDEVVQAELDHRGIGMRAEAQQLGKLVSTIVAMKRARPSDF